METEQVQIDSHDGSSASTERTISISYKSCYSLHQAVLLSMISLKKCLKISVLLNKTDVLMCFN
jgi:hypothetical protein